MHLLKTLLTFFNKLDYRFSVFLIIMMLMTAFIELLGIGSLFPYIKILGMPSYIHSNHTLNMIYKSFGFSTDNGFLIFIGFSIFLMILFKAVMATLNNYFQTKFTYRINNRLSKYCLSSFMRLPYARTIDQNSSVLSKHLLVDVSGVSAVFQALLIIMTDMMVALTLIILMILVDPALVLTVVVFLGVLLLLINRFTKRRINKLSIANEHCNRYAYKASHEALSGLKDTKTYGVEDYFVQRYLKWQYKLSSQLVEFNVISNLPANILNVMGFGVLLIVLLYLIITHGNLVAILPTIGLIAVSVQRLLPSASRISTSIANIRRYQPLVYVVRKAIDALSKEKYRESSDNAVKPDLHFKHSLTLNNVSYRYPGADRNTLNGLSLVIHKGISLGIVGESGAGKSTFIDVLLGLLTIDEGSISCDHIVINRDNDVPLSRLVGYVPQQVFLLDAPIRENIAFGVNPEDIDELAFQRAITIAQLKEFIDQLPDGVNTEIGEKGAKISGGQRQRIGIARALYRDPDILIMDEATNALDAAMEKAFNVALTALMKEKTLIIVAHRLSSVQICDQIVQLEGGRIIASGHYDELLKNSKSFRCIYNLTEETTDA